MPSPVCFLGHYKLTFSNLDGFEFENFKLPVFLSLMIMASSNLPYFSNTFLRSRSVVSSEIPKTPAK